MVSIQPVGPYLVYTISDALDRLSETREVLVEWYTRIRSKGGLGDYGLYS